MANKKRDSKNTRENPSYPEMDKVTIYLKMGCHFIDTGEPELAMDAFTRSIELDPGNARAYDLRAIAYGNNYEWDESIADCNRTINIEPEYEGGYNNRGLAFYKLERFDEAMEDYNRAIELAPRVAIFYNNRGLVHFWKGNYENAISDYNMALKIAGKTDPVMQDLHSQRGEAYASLGMYKKAIADFDRALEIAPCDITAYAYRLWTIEITRDYQ
ncbi:MAG: tetratricopeptide repeat protein [Dehalococcoidales bacterium]|nr:tetratricopeptide repeat protein [Dehalococcoidales bacterium]